MTGHDRFAELAGTAVTDVMSSGDLNNIADRILSKIERRIRTDMPLSDYHDVQTIVSALDDKGFFEIREAVNKTARTLRVSRVTIYNHLKRKYA